MIFYNESYFILTPNLFQTFRSNSESNKFLIKTNTYFYHLRFIMKYFKDLPTLHMEISYYLHSFRTFVYYFLTIFYSLLYLFHHFDFGASCPTQLFI